LQVLKKIQSTQLLTNASNSLASSDQSLSNRSSNGSRKSNKD
jgi:hypothetical protein